MPYKSKDPFSPELVYELFLHNQKLYQINL